MTSEAIVHKLIQRGDKFYLERKVVEAVPTVTNMERMVGEANVEDYVRDGWKRVRAAGQTSVILSKTVIGEKTIDKVVEVEVKIKEIKEDK